MMSDDDEGRASRATTTIWTGPISDDKRAASDVTDLISVTPNVANWLEPEAFLALSLLFRFALGL